MEEIETPSFFSALYHFHCQPVVFLHQHRQIRLRDGIVVLRPRHHRLHGYLFETQIRQVQHIPGEIQVVMGECPPHIVPLLSSALGHFPEFRHNQVIAALSAPERPHFVMDFFPSVDAQDDVRHLAVGKFQNLVIQEHAVGGQGEAELLIVGRFQAPAVRHQLLHHLPVHQGLASEEVHLQVHPVPGICHQEVQRLFAHLQAHQRPPAMVLPLLCEAVLAGQVAVVCDVEAEGLHHRLPFLEVKDIILVDVRREQLSLCRQFQDLVHSFPQFLRRTGQPLMAAQGLFHRRRILHALLRQRLRQGNDVIDQIVHHMDGTAVHIHHDIVSIAFILVYH